MSAKQPLYSFLLPSVKSSRTCIASEVKDIHMSSPDMNNEYELHKKYLTPQRLYRNCKS